MTITIPLERPASTPPAPRRPADDRPSVGPPVTGPLPPARLSLGSRCRRTLRRLQRHLLAVADDCPPILLYTAHRS
ncbi:hypothetical protein MCAG_03928 [Micromonospora sp. ATCC 39149]|uniref:Uncharacterized protein n=1 Tax=Micromonospora carbonacea TaxID=47853 RepID=A0A7D5Y6F4_9ACTN|nr:hypothetical protein [Micromonospora sp. ATCC 39149]EEP73601.1 hypothetical protein MCAG_03928 [Micromonospora sp. ATCC 39149]QLJ99518.1 hypothetical protein HZU44_05180 [Micromonospora carbonacea]